MAIVSALPGLEVTVEVGCEPLVEYDYHPVNAPQHVDTPHTISKYVKAPPSTEFEIHTLYRAPYNPTSLVQVDILLDGTYVLVPYEEPGRKDDCEGYKYAKATFITDGVSSTQSFRFSDLTAEEDDQLVTADSKRKVASIGQITLYLYYIQWLLEASPTEIPRSSLEQPNIIGHKAMKATVTPGDSLTCQTSLSKPEVCNRVSFNKIKTISNEPFATFNFYYRSTAALKSLGIMDRTPTPSPEPEPIPKDPAAMNEEELRAELIRLRNEREQTVRVKRERADSVAIVVGNDDEDIQWVSSQPKRLRRSPGEGDEVLIVED